LSVPGRTTAPGLAVLRRTTSYWLIGTERTGASLTNYRDIYIEKLIEALRDNPKIVALWEGGSAATGSTDQYSDLDLHALCACESDEAFELMESVMPPITHRYIEPAGRDLRHRIYFHDGAPKHFIADVWS
jgi:Nucleotidyltransferase domain